MKIWLLDILACPIDKYFPLKLYIFSFENTQEQFQSLIDTYMKRDIEFIESEKVIETFSKDNELIVKDDIIIEKTNLRLYIESIKSSLKEFENVYDKTNKQQSPECFQIINSEVKLRINSFSEKPDPNLFYSILPELYIINKIKLNFEIKSGILFCSNCKRWYPIMDTIPQMLPDKYRDKKKEIDFLQNHKNLIDAEFFNQELKPFTI
ncbi:MAG: Trm112 family protein [Promethearchaeota archaeon]